MGGRWIYLPLVALLGAAVAILPGVAASESLPVEAADEGIYYHHWSNSVQTVLAGDTVKFANPYTTESHGLKFTGGPATPSCSGIPAAAGEAGGAPNWHGECSFATAGTYTFICTVHPTEMKGTITVDANGTTTTTTTPTPGPTPTATTPSPTPTRTSPLSSAPLVGARQHGGVVRGTLTIDSTGAGDELAIDVLARAASLAAVRHGHSSVRVGGLVRSSVAAGRLPFSIRLNVRARRALARRHRLVLSVRIVLTPVYGEPTTIVRQVVEHR